MPCDQARVLFLVYNNQFADRINTTGISWWEMRYPEEADSSSKSGSG